ncbi:11697_t:CDS:1, partial [Funneliformis caledonium]
YSVACIEDYFGHPYRLTNDISATLERHLHQPLNCGKEHHSIIADDLFEIVV